MSSCNESSLVAGNEGYSAAYETLLPLGKGAFGCVRLARRRADQQLVSSLFTWHDQDGYDLDCDDRWTVCRQYVSVSSLCVKSELSALCNDDGPWSCVECSLRLTVVRLLK